MLKWWSTLFRVVFLTTMVIGICWISALTHAQSSSETRKPISMMLVIDNSCSMFPQNQILPGCEIWGNDPDALRVSGASLFLARLGFSEANENAYQIGVIHLGDTPELVSPLQSISTNRDAIAKLIHNPKPQPATRIVPALELAYHELRTSPNRLASNMPAILLITDGAPYPPQGQSNEDLERLVSANLDVPLFLLLLQDNAASSEEYERYAVFWEQMQARYKHVFTYRIADSTQIEQTYNQIIAQLQNTIPTSVSHIEPNVPLDVFVNRYVQKLVITVIHPSNAPRGIVTIRDPKGNIVDESESGVKRFAGESNLIEVISIGRERLRPELRDDIWTISSDASVNVFRDFQGAYGIQMLQPSVSFTDVTGVYLATERFPPTQGLIFRFQLVDDTGTVVKEPQPLHGKVLVAGDKESDLRIPIDTMPDNAGVYEVRFTPSIEFPQSWDQRKRFTFILNAGIADDSTPQSLPIARVQVLVDIVAGPYIDAIEPEPLLCNATFASILRVSVGDYDRAAPDSLKLRLDGAGEAAVFTSESSGIFTADLTSVCAELVQALPCGASDHQSLHLHMVGQMTDGSAISPAEQSFPVVVEATNCPTPTPTLPDDDQDGLANVVDKCQDQWGFNILQGCIPLWAKIGGVVLGSLLLATLIFWVIPAIRITLWPPPKGYVLVSNSKRKDTPKSFQQIGRTRRTNKILIGSDRKRAHLYVPELKPVEFVVVRNGDAVQVLDAQNNLKDTLNNYSKTIFTSDSATKLIVSLDQNQAKQS